VRAELAPIINSAVEAVQPLMERKGHQFSLSMPDELLTVEADPVRLGQVLGNLLTNAAKYTEPQGRIDLIVEREGQSVCFRVRDNGIGIAPEARADIFGMFAQLSPAIERSEGGLGIGLALAKGLVELHGGQITVSSGGLGKGSEFVVRIPLVSSVPAGKSDGDEVVQPASRANTRDVILADDNSDALESLAMLLEMEGHTVRKASDGLAAIELVRQRLPDVMLLDIGMPGMNGHEVAQRVREEYAEAEIILIALTGWGQPGDRVRTRAAGFDHHLTKPVEFDELAQLLNRTPRSAAATQGRAANM